MGDFFDIKLAWFGSRYLSISLSVYSVKGTIVLLRVGKYQCLNFGLKPLFLRLPFQLDGCNHCAFEDSVQVFAIII